MHRWKGRTRAVSGVTSREDQSKLCVVEQIAYYTTDSVVVEKKNERRQRLASRDRDDRQHQGKVARAASHDEEMP